MSARVSLVLVTIGAILAFAVRAEPSVIDLQTTGLILMAVGLIRPALWGWASLRPKDEPAPTDARETAAPTSGRTGTPVGATPLRTDEGRRADAAARRVS